MTLRSLLSAPTRREFPASSPTRRGLPQYTAPVIVGLSLVAGGGAIAALPTAASIPAPPSKALPADLDVAAPYISPYRCSGTDKPGVTAFAKLLNQHYGYHVWGISRSCGDDHGEGRALDWMVNAKTADGLALGNAITSWLIAPDAQGRKGAMARRIGISYIIWNKRIWGVYAMGDGWRPYNGPNPHTDHIHFTFSWDGAYQQTSWWTGRALTATRYTAPTANPSLPKPAPTTMTASGYPLLAQGSVGSDVTLAQKVIGATPDGEFGPKTAAALSAWQGAKGVPVTGKLDNATWTKMVSLGLVPARASNAGNATTPPPAASGLAAHRTTTLQSGSRGPAVTALQKALGGLTADGEFGPLTRAKVEAYQRSAKLPVTGVVTTPMWDALIGANSAAPAPTPPPPAASGLAAHRTTTLQSGSRGPAVTALQKALGGLTADGEFGPLTRAKVEAYQRSAKLPVTGVVTTPMWDALIGSATPTPTPPKPAPSTNTSTAKPVLQVGAKGAAVRELQAALGGLLVDGEFGALTKARVENLQRASGLPVTGVVDAATWAKLDAKTKPLQAYYNTVLKRGSTGASVVALQKALRVGADGEFGPLTETAVKAAQKKAGIAQTGVVATLTWQAIERQI